MTEETNGEWQNWRAAVDRDRHAQGETIAAILELLEEVRKTGPLHWENISASRRAVLMAQLADFVAFLNRTYIRDNSELTLAPCWYRHPDVVWQLTALFAAFTQTYAVGAPVGMEQVTFHELGLWPVLARIRSNESMKNCKQGKHVSGRAIGEDPHLRAQIQNWRNNDQRSLCDLSEESFDMDLVVDPPDDGRVHAGQLDFDMAQQSRTAHDGYEDADADAD